jgi:hypothetical protein
LMLSGSFAGISFSSFVIWIPSVKFVLFFTILVYSFILKPSMTNVMYLLGGLSGNFCLLNADFSLVFIFECHVDLCQRGFGKCKNGSA